MQLEVRGEAAFECALEAMDVSLGDAKCDAARCGSGSDSAAAVLVVLCNCDK